MGMDLVSVPASRIVTVAKAATDMVEGGGDVDFLCFGESDRRSPASARQAMIQAVRDGHTRYADVRGTAGLRQGLARHLTALHGRPVAEGRIQVTASGMAAIGCALSAIVLPGDRVLVHGPAWPNPGNAALLRGAHLDEIPLEPTEAGGFALDMDRLDRALRGVRAFILNSPNNPTGWTATRAELEAILAACRRHRVWLLSDEVYSRLVYGRGRAAPSLLDFAEPTDRLVVCNSFSKTYAMTGWRVGWMVVPADELETFTNIVEIMHSGVAPFAQAGAAAALLDEGFARDFRDHCAVGRALCMQALAGIDGVRVPTPDAAFYAWLRVARAPDSLALALSLVREHRVAVAPGSAFGPAGEGCLRVCFAQSPDMLCRALDRLRRGLLAL